MPLTVRISRDIEAEDIPLPRYATLDAAGMDLCAAVAQEVVLQPGERMLVPTGLRIAIPSGYEGQIRPRSGLALHHGIGMVNSPGTIDCDYRGAIGVLLVNHGSEPFAIRRGERIAQLVIAPVCRADWELVTSLDATERGDGGFGHTGA